MNKSQVILIRRRLDDYQCYKVLAEEADKKALLVQQRIYDAGSPKAVSWGKVEPNQNHVEMSSILNSLIDEQKVYEDEARDYHESMKAIEAFIDENFEGDVKEIAKRHYIDGIRFYDLEEELFVSKQAMSNAISRALEILDYDKIKYDIM